MLCECVKCGEHWLDCTCIDETLVWEVQEKVSAVYLKYKDHPREFAEALGFFIDVAQDDLYIRLMREKGNALNKIEKEES